MFWGHPMAVPVYLCLVVLVVFAAVVANWRKCKYKKSRRK